MRGLTETKARRNSLDFLSSDLVRLSSILPHETLKGLIIGIDYRAALLTCRVATGGDSDSDYWTARISEAGSGLGEEKVHYHLRTIIPQPL